MSIIVKVYELKLEYCQGVYWPSDDSFLLADTLSNRVKGKLAVDVGSGTGIISLIMAEKGMRVIAIDVDLNSAKCTWNNAKRNKLDHLVDVICCNLIEPLRTSAKFDIIVSNPPYLPGNWRKEPDIYGGIRGVEMIEELISQARPFIDKRARLYLVISSISNFTLIMRKIKEMSLNFNILCKKSLSFFEDLFVLEIHGD